MDKKILFTINRIAKENSAKKEFSLDHVLLTVENSKDFYNMVNTLRKYKQIKAIYHRETLSARVYETSYYNELKNSENKKTQLVNCFWLAIRKGANNYQAKAEQYKLAVKLDAIKEFKAIYE